ncbi:MAG: hypothetical protein E6X17_13845 [Sporomusaceae bacterium]|nr:hypothetical protein [Sporomusaceae bacterium]
MCSKAEKILFFLIAIALIALYSWQCRIVAGESELFRLPLS